MDCWPTDPGEMPIWGIEWPVGELIHEKGACITWIWKEKPSREPKAKTDSQFCLETGLYLAFYCTVICEQRFVGTFPQQETNFRKVKLRQKRHRSLNTSSTSFLPLRFYKTVASIARCFLFFLFSFVFFFNQYHSKDLRKVSYQTLKICLAIKIYIQVLHSVHLDI